MILFLDFDGTLHPHWEAFNDAHGRSHMRPYTGPKLAAAPLLAALLAPFGARVEIVISSRWAYGCSLDEICGLLPSDVAMRVVDSIWLAELISPVWSEYHSLQATRHACIRLWLHRRRPDYRGPWLALDDDDVSWPDEDRSHLVHARGTLASPAVQRELAERLCEGVPGTVPLRRLWDTIAVLERLCSQSGLDSRRAVHWYQHEPLMELGGSSAERLVAAGRSAGVLRYLDNLAAGASG